MADCDVIIIGAGIVGTAAAKVLGEQGRNVVLFDRSFDEPDRIVGELMQPAGLELLHKMGLYDCVEGIDAVEEHGYQINFESEWLRMPFPECNSLPHSHDSVKAKTACEGELADDARFHGCSFHHGRFVQKLRHAATSTKGVTGIEGTVTEVLFDGAKVMGVKYRKKSDSDEASYGNERVLTAPLVVVGDGCLSKFRKLAHYDKPQTVSHFVGVLMEDIPTLPHEHHGHVILTKTTPVLIYRIGSGEVRILVDIPLTKLPGKEDLKRLLLEETLPQLPEEIQEAFRRAVEKGPVRSMPNQKLHPNAKIVPGLLLVGDALNTRHPLTGAGMTCALTDAILMREFESVDLYNSKEVCKTMQTIYQKHNQATSTINILSFALYQVFSGPYALRKACCAYLKKGGENAAGPMSMLSGLVTDRNTFLYHYCRVGLHSVKTILPNLIECMQVGYAAVHIVTPLLYNEVMKPALWQPQLPQLVEEDQNTAVQEPQKVK
eukprot:TRINITY_DN67053_c6_g2_i1.p1 TRINITY_DN67053_c6_g2~~TRINITY_DN67053_c6_g2_i1.p1  ORF type:complete len:502 (+),score=36.77 TRINITY_DN67053_c6_g2_i1:34-1506(+)